MRFLASRSCQQGVLGAALLLLTAPAWAGDGPFDRASLKGITAIQVGVEPVDPEAEAQGLTTAQIQADVESRLREAGIPVAASAAAYLYVNLNVTKLAIAPLYSFALDVQVVQSVSLLRDPAIPGIRAVTWSTAAGGVEDRAQLQSLRRTLTDLVDQFIGAYLEQNP